MQGKTSRRSRLNSWVVLTMLGLLIPGTILAQVPHPSETLGFAPGTDYKLADYSQLVAYYRALDRASERVRLVEIGSSVLKKPLLVLILTSEANMRDLNRWRETSETLARARVDEPEARRLAAAGKAIVWIDGGLHATEIAPSQMLPLLAHRVATEESEEMKKIRDEVVLLLMPCMNPDGLDIVQHWYTENLGTPFETTRPPELYHHYVGHDNNRDWFMANMPETQAVNDVLYRRWFPQIVYNHHQTGPAWARIFLPPFADPVNPNIHPGVTTGVNMVGSAMANRFAMEGMPGAVSDMTYSMWWNGGMRTVPYFHNMIGILTETSHASATPRYYDPQKLPAFVGNPRRGQAAPTSATDVFYPYPWKGGESHLKDSVDYTLVASMAVLRIAADLREKWLYDMYRMGRDAIDRAASDPVAYAIPAEQWDSGEANNLVNVLVSGGVEVHRATSGFDAGGKSFGAGTYVLRGDQSFFPYVVDLMEKQDYPDRRRSPDGPPDPPYDLAGWTLPMQMGVAVTRIDESFEAELEAVSGPVQTSPGAVTAGSFGYLLSRRPNASAKAVNRLLRQGERVHWAGAPFEASGGSFEAGTILIERGSETESRLRQLSGELGLDFVGVGESPDVVMHKLEPTKVGLYKSYDPSMDEGWTRWLLEQYEFELTSLKDADLRGGDLSSLDVIVLPDQEPESILNGHLQGTMPDAYVGGVGVLGSLALKRFVEAGGTLVALDGASGFAISQLGLPVRDVTEGIPDTRFFIPGSLIRATVDTSHPLAWGMQEEVATSFVRSRAFDFVELSRRGEGGEEKTKPAPAPPVETVVAYAKKDLLMSGWALGAEQTIGGKAAVARVGLGEGQVILFGFRPQFRGQPRGTYKLFFNALQGATLEEMPWNGTDGN